MKQILLLLIKPMSPSTNFYGPDPTYTSWVIMIFILYINKNNGENFLMRNIQTILHVNGAVTKRRHSKGFV